MHEELFVFNEGVLMFETADNFDYKMFVAMILYEQTFTLMPEISN